MNHWSGSWPVVSGMPSSLGWVLIDTRLGYPVAAPLMEIVHLRLQDQFLFALQEVKDGAEGFDYKITEKDSIIINYHKMVLLWEIFLLGREY